MTFSSVEVDLDRRIVRREDAEVKMTPAEYHQRRAAILAEP